MESSAGTELPRLTFEEVLKNQTELVEMIETLIKKNSRIHGEDWIKFMNVYRRATLGLGAYTTLGTNRMPGADEQNLDYLIFSFLHSSRPIRVGWAEGEQWNVEPRELWQAILDRLLGEVFGVALQQAIKLSPEHVPWKPSGSYPLRPRVEARS